MKEPYVLINTILGAVVILILSYSFAYPVLSQNNLVVPSSCEGMPAVYCKSRGLTRAFSAITHGDVQVARHYNPYSVPIFLFFVLQLPARFIYSVLFLRWRKDSIILFDVVTTVIFFLIAFLPLIIIR